MIHPTKYVLLSYDVCIICYVQFYPNSHACHYPSHERTSSLRNNSNRFIRDEEWKKILPDTLKKSCLLVLAACCFHTSTELSSLLLPSQGIVRRQTREQNIFIDEMASICDYTLGLCWLVVWNRWYNPMREQKIHWMRRGFWQYFAKLAYSPTFSVAISRQD